jgi:GTPase SAR1 family protein
MDDFARGGALSTMGMGSPTTFASSPVANYKSGVRNMEMQHKPLLLLRAKVVVVGDACVGKTAITQMFNSGGHNYPKNYIMV